jgi:transcriptional regulator GlxA family with amidase domain
MAMANSSFENWQVREECRMNFGILVFNKVEELDFVGPWEMLTMWSKFAEGPQNCLIIGESSEPVICAKGLSINPHVSFADCPKLDYLLVPGGEGTRAEFNNRITIDFIATQAVHCKSVLSVCTGAFLLHAAGLLSGKKATTHWSSLDRLRELGDVDVIEDRFVSDGSVWSSAGVSAGIDMMLAFIASVAGTEAAGKVQFGAEYYPSSVKWSGTTTVSRANNYVQIFACPPRRMPRHA